MKKTSLEEFKKSLGNKIKLRREELNLKQLDLAVRLGGKDKQTISRYEKSGANPTIFNLIQIAEALELTVHELLEYEPLSDKT